MCSRARWLDSLWTRVFYRMMYFSLCVPFQRHFLQGHLSCNFTKFIVGEKLDHVTEGKIIYCIGA